MKINLLLTGIILAIPVVTTAQANTKFTLVNDAFYGGPSINGLKLRANLGILFRNPESQGYEHLHLDKAVGPTGLRTEFLVSDRIGLGADAIYNLSGGSFSKHEPGYDPITGNDSSIHLYAFTRNQVRVMARINFHKRITKKRLDLYSGLGFGTNTNIVKMTRDKVDVDPKDFLKSTGIKFSARACIGFRWYPAKPVGINFELGIGGPLVSAGVSSHFSLKKPSIPELSKPDGDTDNLKNKKDGLQKQQDKEEETRSKATEKSEEMKQKAKSSAEEERKKKAEEEKQRLENKKEELEKEKLELEIKKLEQEKKQLEKQVEENKEKP